MSVTLVVVTHRCVFYWLWFKRTCTMSGVRASPLVEYLAYTVRYSLYICGASDTRYPLSWAS